MLCLGLDTYLYTYTLIMVCIREKLKLLKKGSKIFLGVHNRLTKTVWADMDFNNKKLWHVRCDGVCRLVCPQFPKVQKVHAHYTDKWPVLHLWHIRIFISMYSRFLYAHFPVYALYYVHTEKLLKMGQYKWKLYVTFEAIR